MMPSKLGFDSSVAVFFNGYLTNCCIECVHVVKDQLLCLLLTAQEDGQSIGCSVILPVVAVCDTFGLIGVGALFIHPLPSLYP